MKKFTEESKKIIEDSESFYSLQHSAKEDSSRLFNKLVFKGSTGGEISGDMSKM